MASHEPDYMGWIFSPASPRRIAPEKARNLIRAIRRTRPGIRHVGVLARNTVPDIHRIVGAAGGELDYLQLVDDGGLMEALRNERTHVGLPPIAPALRVKEQISDWDLRRRGPVPFHVLDSFVPGRPGGTGKRLAPELIREVRAPYLLAGGLRPENVREAVAGLHAMGVDVSSGLEDGIPGRKNPSKVAEFVRLARGG